MDQDQKPNNVIQFPGKSKSTDESQNETNIPARPAIASGEIKSPRKRQRKSLGAMLIAVMLGAGAVNRAAFQNSETSLDAASQATSARAIASLERFSWERDAKWEKELAERLASPQIRALASAHIGRPATKEEKLRWGVLEEKYTITYGADQQQINGILFQDGREGNPAYILDRIQFLKDYGLLFHATYKSAKLKSVEQSDQNTIESYTLFGEGDQPKGEVRFELDRYKRLLSLKVAPVQI
jgi:hypothetical protein